MASLRLHAHCAVYLFNVRKFYKYFRKRTKKISKQTERKLEKWRISRVFIVRHWILPVWSDNVAEIPGDDLKIE